MMTECARERDVLDAVASGRWSDELRTHAASCAVCADVADVARAFRDDADVAPVDVHIPPSGRVWWRAELRVRQEAARAAARPISVVHAVAAAAVLLLAIGLVARFWPSLAEPVGDLWAWSSGMAATAPSPLLISLAVVVGASLLLAPLALYFVFSEK
jgi:hypothetical protein